MVEISVILPALNEEENIKHVLEQLSAVVKHSDLSFEILVIDGGSSDRTLEIAKENGADCIQQPGKGYADALITGFKAAKGSWICTLDCDNSHPPFVIHEMLLKRHEYDLIVASRFMKGGGSEANLFRLGLSKTLNKIFKFVLSIPVNDFSSGYRLYKRQVIRENYFSVNYDILPEILVSAYVQGYKISEVPFQYKERAYGSSNARILRFGFDFLRTLFKLRKLRFSHETREVLLPYHSKE